MAEFSYSNIRKHLLAIIAIVVAVSLLALFGMSQMAKIAHFHELNAQHLRASDALRSLLNKAAPAVPDITSLRNAVTNVRNYSTACLKEIGLIERVSMHALGQEMLIKLCQDDMAQANQALALIDDYTRGDLDGTQMCAQIGDAALDFVGRSDDFIAPVAAVGSAVLRMVLTSMMLIALVAVVIVGGLVNRVSDAVKQLHSSNASLAVSEQRNRQLAMYDNLTGLPNRNLFVDRLGHCQCLA